MRTKSCYCTRARACASAHRLSCINASCSSKSFRRRCRSRWSLPAARELPSSQRAESSGQISHEIYRPTFHSPRIALDTNRTFLVIFPRRKIRKGAGDRRLFHFGTLWAALQPQSNLQLARRLCSSHSRKPILSFGGQRVTQGAIVPLLLQLHTEVSSLRHASA